MPDKPLYYWDACVFLAWLKNENRPNPVEMSNLFTVAQKINTNEARLITSALTKAEVLRSTLNDDAISKWDNVLKRKNCFVADTTDRIWTLTHDLRDFYHQRKNQDNLPTLTLPDAVHLATAIYYDANALHTFDENNEPRNRRALIPLSGNIGGQYNLVICKPSLSQQTLALI